MRIDGTGWDRPLAQQRNPPLPLHGRGARRADDIQRGGNGALSQSALPRLGIAGGPTTAATMAGEHADPVDDTRAGGAAWLQGRKAGRRVVRLHYRKSILWLDAGWRGGYNAGGCLTYGERVKRQGAEADAAPRPARGRAAAA